MCIFKELRKALYFLQAAYHSLSISELDSSHCESWCSLSFLTSCCVAYSRVRKRFRLCKGIELPVNTFSSWQLQWWSQLWVEYPAWNLKGRCTCTFITFRDGNDSLAIGKYLADSACRNIFRLSKCSKPIPPDGQLTLLSYTCIRYIYCFMHNESRHSFAVYDFLLMPFYTFAILSSNLPNLPKDGRQWWRRLTAAGAIFGSTTFPR